MTTVGNCTYVQGTLRAGRSRKNGGSYNFS